MNKICDKKMNFEECELAIVRMAVDKAEIKQGRQTATSIEIKKIIGILEIFLRNKKLIVYGGLAINNLLPKKDQFYDKSSVSIRLIDDSSFVQYVWDEKSRTLLGNYEKTKINKPKILTYFVADNELLFINTYYKTLKSCLQDNIKRQFILNYLNQVKNYYNDN